MKKALKVTFGTMLAVSMAAPLTAQALVKDPANHIAVWGELTYMRPSSNGLSVGDYALAPFPANIDGARNHYFLEPENDFDWKAGISFRIPNYRHTRVFFSFDHFSNNEFQGDVNIRNLGLAPTVGPFVGTQATYDYDLKNYEYRLGAIHDLHFGDHFCMDLIAFFEYDKVRQETFETISRNPAVELRTRHTENEARGWGPGVGFMTRWFAHSPHWHIFAGADTALIKMENEFHQTFAGVTGAFAGQSYDYNPANSDSLVGKIDIEFGVNYACAFTHEMHGMKWDISLGMRYMNMINVFKNGNTAYQPFAFSNGGAAQQVTPVYLGAAQDWGKYGPFLRFRLGGNHS